MARTRMRGVRILWLAAALALFGACTGGGDDRGGPWASDAGSDAYAPPHESGSDAGSRPSDAGPSDAGPSWTGPYDASAPPAWEDAGRADAAPLPELPDGGGDAGVADAAAAEDAAVDLCVRRETREPLVLHLSADDSNSMASPVFARSRIRAGSRPPAHRIRTYEFLNYYGVSYAEPAQGRATLAAELAPGEEEGELELQLGVQSAPLPEQSRLRVLTFVLDTSGSMGGEPMELERAAVRAIAGQLRRGDIVSMVEWSTSRTVPLEAHVASGPNDPLVVAAANRLAAGGGTDLHGGLTHGYELARAHYDADKLNRVILVSDGGANAGITSLEVIAAAAEDSETDGIYLVGVGVGGSDYRDDLMDAVTDAGRGAYVFLDSAAEAARIFGPQHFDEVMEVALMDVRVELTLPWYMAMREFHGEEYSTSPKEVRPQHLAPGDTMVFHQVVGACDPSLLDPADPIGVRTTYIRATDRLHGSEELSATIDELLTADGPGLARGRAIVAFAEALKEMASLYGEELEAVRARTRVALDAADPDHVDPDFEELRGLLAAYR